MTSDSRVLLMGVVVAIVLGGTTVATAGVADVTAPGPRDTSLSTSVDVGLAPTATEVATGANTTVDVVVDGSTDGIGAYEITVDVPFSTVAHIAAVEPEGAPEYQNVSITRDGGTATLTVAGASFEDDGSTTIATVTLSGDRSGKTPIRLDTTSLVTPGGQEYSLDTEQDTNLTVSDVVVEASPTTQSVERNETTTVDIVANGVDSGVGAYDITVQSNKTTSAMVQNVSLTGSPTMQSVSYGPSNGSVAVIAAGRNAASTDNQVLFTLTIGTNETGDTNLAVEVESLATQQGSEYTVPVVNNGSLSVEEANTPPTARFTITPDTVTAGGTVTLNASRSTDEQNIASYQWDVDGDERADTNGEVVSYTFDTSGVYDVELAVSDDSGATARTTKTVTVESASGSEPALEFVPAEQTSVPGITTFELVVMNADAGVGSYEFGVGSSNTSVAAIADVEVIGADSSDPLTSVDVAANGSTATVSVDAADISVTGNVTIATVEINASATGEATVSTSNVSIGNIDGSSYTLSKGSSGYLTVSDVAPTVVGEPAGDPDGDDVYEDINGDGEVNIVDVSALFNNRNSDVVQSNPTLFDFNNDGSFNIADVSRLFQDAI